MAPSPAPRGRGRNPDRGTSAPAQTRRDQPTRLSPEEAVTAVRERVQKLERLSKCWGEDSGPEFQVLQNSLKKAKAAAKVFQLGSSHFLLELSSARAGKAGSLVFSFFAFS